LTTFGNLEVDNCKERITDSTHEFPSLPEDGVITVALDYLGEWKQQLEVHVELWFNLRAK